MISKYETSYKAIIKLYVFQFFIFYFFGDVDIFKFSFILNFI